jgi:hypothetical protein
MVANKAENAVPARKPQARPSTTVPRRRGIRGGLIAVVLAAGAMIAALGLIGGQGAASAAPTIPVLSPDSMATVETVEGDALPVREYELFLAQDRAETFAYFRQHYGVADSATFWTTAHGGQTPTAYLKQLALSDATKALVQQVLATKYGVVSRFTYGGFLAAWQEQNASRAAALAAHQVIYGPTSYRESDYFTYVSEQMSEQLQIVLADKGVIKVTDAELESYYNTHKPQFTQSQGDDQRVGSPRVAGPSASPTAADFTQLKPVVEQYYVQAAYTALVAHHTQQAVVHVNQSVLAAIAIN